MAGAFEAIPITERVFWVGAVDWGLRDFHGYATSRGSTYNAYLIRGTTPILIDTVKSAFYDEMMARIASVIDPREIAVIVSNHTEMDHTGCLPRALAAIEPEMLIASTQGRQALGQHFHWDQEVRVAPEGEALTLGDATLRFAATPMLHWPDSMFTLFEEEGVLFSNDAFGMHLASSERFADELDPDLLRREAAKYYANILLPFSPLVTKLLAKLPGLGWSPRMIAPDHGPVWRRDLERILSLYGQWALQRPTRKAVLAYGTMWQSTARMARAIGEGLVAGGLTARLMPLGASHRSDVVTELLEAGALLVGSPTMNNQLFPPVADLLTYVKGLKPRNLVGAAFGSHGWSGEGVKQIEEQLNAMKLALPEPGLRVLYVPDAEALAQCRALGARVAEHVQANLAAEA